MIATTATTATTAATATSVSPETMVTFGIVAIVLLVILLVTKELSGASVNPKAQRLSRIANIGVIPLALTFGVITISRVLAVF